MTRKVRMIVGAAALAVAGGAVLATPIVGLVSPFLAVGSHDAEVHAVGRGTATNGNSFKVELETEGPASISTQVGSISAGGHNGWHSHPGLTILTITQGAIRWYDEDCMPHDYKAGDSWVESSLPHAYVVTSTVASQIVSTFITAKGKPYRTDLPAPDCAAGLGL